MGVATIILDVSWQYRYWNKPQELSSTFGRFSSTLPAAISMSLCNTASATSVAVGQINHHMYFSHVTPRSVAQLGPCYLPEMYSA
jgi:hypothetical protein